MIPQEKDTYIKNLWQQHNKNTKTSGVQHFPHYNLFISSEYVPEYPYTKKRSVEILSSEYLYKYMMEQLIKKGMVQELEVNKAELTITVGGKIIHIDLEKDKIENKIEEQLNNLKDKIQIENEIDVYDYIRYYNISIDILLKACDIAYKLFNVQNIKLYILDDHIDGENLILGIYIKDMEPIDVSNKLDMLYEKLYNEFSHDEISKFIIHLEFI
jgi:hypothetical protein